MTKKDDGMDPPTPVWSINKSKYSFDTMKWVVSGVVLGAGMWYSLIMGINDIRKENAEFKRDHTELQKAFIEHSRLDWTKADQIVYNREFAMRNSSNSVPDVDSIWRINHQ